ncbi:MAG: cytidylate kinase-like family protein [Clostridiales bacterium]|nr:cytidylate kinase-like family protein [Clostridiales bacterium]
MKKRIITISREFGSGGRTIGRQVAQELGFEFYDKELIEKVAEESGFDKQYIEEQGEYAPAKSSFAYAFIGRDRNGMSISDYIWQAQRKIILSLAEKGNCVIVGRCADYILQDREDCLNVFIHADMEKRAERIVKLYGETDKAPKKRLEEKDKKRKVNYRYYTDREWGASQNYHICLDSGEFGIERCAKIIAELAREE